MNKRIYRSHESKVISGVCGGIGEYFDIDPTWVRILFVLSIFANGLGLVAYLIAWIVIPIRPLPLPGDEGSSANASVGGNEGYQHTQNHHTRQHGAGFWPGIILIALGFVFLANRLFFWFDFEHIWPVLLIALGVVLIVRAMNTNGTESKGTETVSQTTTGEVTSES